MGKGNWRPNNADSEDGFGLFYVEKSEIYPGDDYDGYHFDDFMIGLQDCLPESFEVIYPQSKWRNDSQIVAENKQFELVMADNENSMAFALLIKEDIEPLCFAQRNLDKTFDSIASRVNKHYPILFRSGPWTSSYIKIGNYTP